MRPIPPLLIICAVLATHPSTSAAKGIAGVDVCGAAGCQAVDEAFFHAGLADGIAVGAPVAAAPFVTVHVAHHTAPGAPTHEERFTYLPSLGAVRAQGETRWIRLSAFRRAELDEIVATVTPRPAAQLSGVAQPAPDGPDDGAAWWTIAAVAAATLALLARFARYARSALKARPRASKSAN
jgi:hypothetical protein